MVFHLGIEHHKVNDALRKDGFRLLLNQIKSEPYDLKERVGKMFPVEAASKDDGGKETLDRCVPQNEGKSVLVLALLLSLLLSSVSLVGPVFKLLDSFCHGRNLDSKPQKVRSLD